MTQPLRWGVLGTGMIAGKLATDLKHTPTGIHVASGSRLQETADLFAAKHGGRGIAGYEALINDPDLVVLDEPTSGLDPIGAADFDELIMTLRDTLGLAVYMVTHDLDSLFMACDRIAVLGERKVLVEGPLSTMLEYDVRRLSPNTLGPWKRL